MTTPENVPPDDDPLTAAEVADLPHGAEIIVIWCGGNGPHRYRIHHDRGAPHAVPVREWEAGPDGPLWFYPDATPGHWAIRLTNVKETT